MQILIAAAILGALGFVLGLLIFLVEKYFGVDVDLSVREVEEMLPGVNCGSCGFAGCQEWPWRFWKTRFQAMQALETRKSCRFTGVFG